MLNPILLLLFYIYVAFQYRLTLEVGFIRILNVFSIAGFLRTSKVGATLMMVTRKICRHSINVKLVDR